MISTEELYKLFKRYPTISTDTRKELKNSIFFALPGDHFDGNKFAMTALEKGAAYAVVDKARYANRENVLLVGDTLKSLQELASMHRAKHAAKVLGITGSNGKTTTKELIAAVLETSKRITFTSGNLNNHIGVPLSLLRITADTEIAVIEMGANHVGEIAGLCSLARPDAGIITNIGKAHLEGFGSYEGVIRAKSELYQHLRKTGGSVIVNADDPLLMQLSEGLDRFTYGSKESAVAGELMAAKPTLALRWHYRGAHYEGRTNLYGRYNFYNIMAAIATGLYFGLPPAKINQGIQKYVAENNRSQKLQTATNNIYLDAYNANPVSMREAIRSFEEYASADGWLIMGDMFELGPASEEEHLNIIRILEKSGFKHVLLVGKDFNSLREDSGFHFFPDVNEAGKFLHRHPIRNKDILIKGSRGMQLERLLDYL